MKQYKYTVESLCCADDDKELTAILSQYGQRGVDISIIRAVPTVGYKVIYTLLLKEEVNG